MTTETARTATSLDDAGIARFPVRCSMLFVRHRSMASASRARATAGGSAALDIVEAEARELGLETTRDAGANLVVTLDRQRDATCRISPAARIWIRCRKAAISTARRAWSQGLAVLARFKRDRIVPRRTIKLFGLRGEESSRFGKAYMGSLALFGKLTPADLRVADPTAARSAIACVTSVSDVARVGKGEPLLNAKSIAAWVELHIEQGPVLVARDLPVGIVTGIRGNVRHRVVECVGEAGHSGAVPRWLRHDAVFATAELISHLDRHWRTLLERGRDVVITSALSPPTRASTPSPASRDSCVQLRIAEPEQGDPRGFLRPLPFGMPARRRRARRGVQA